MGDSKRVRPVFPSVFPTINADAITSIGRWLAEHPAQQLFVGVGQAGHEPGQHGFTGGWF
jgi:hypothetical protein